MSPVGRDVTSSHWPPPQKGDRGQEVWVRMRREDVRWTLNALAEGTLSHITDTVHHEPDERGAPRDREVRFEERIPVVERPGRTHYIKVKEIDWFEARSQYVRLHAGARELLARGPNLSIANLADSLDPLQFVRVHRSHIVNLCSVVALEVEGTGRHFVVLTGERHVPVSQQNWRRLRALLSRFDGEA